MHFFCCRFRIVPKTVLDNFYTFSELLDTPIDLLSIKQKRKLVTLLAAPSDPSKVKGWYQNTDNCPDWWSELNLPWVSVNNQKGSQQKCYFTVEQLNQLISSYKCHQNQV